jgi:hypothetical protein
MNLLIACILIYSLGLDWKFYPVVLLLWGFSILLQDPKDLNRIFFADAEPDMFERRR